MSTSGNTPPPSSARQRPASTKSDGISSGSVRSDAEPTQRSMAASTITAVQEAPPPTTKRSTASSLIRKFGAKLGITKQTSYTPEFIDTCKDLELYKVVIDDVAAQICAVIQNDASVFEALNADRPNPLGTMFVDYADGASPYEVAERLLRAAPEFLNNAHLKEPTELVRDWSRAHRRYQLCARRAIHGIRTFINVDYDSIMNERKVLDKKRQELDFAKYDARKPDKTPALTEQHNAELARASKSYDAQLAKVNSLLEIYQQTKLKHADEIVNFHATYQHFHDSCTRSGRGKKSGTPSETPTKTPSKLSRERI